MDAGRIEDALRYMGQVEQQLAGNPQIYTTFLDVLRDFKLRRLDIHIVIRRVCQLFNEFPQLVMGFNAFLPPGFNIQVVQDGILVVEPENPIQDGQLHGDGEDEMEDDDGDEEEQGVEDEEAEEQQLGGEKMERDGEVQEVSEEPEEEEKEGLIE